MPLGQDTEAEPAPGVQQVNYYEEVEKQPSASLLAEARRLVDTSKQSAKTVTSPRQGRSLMELWRRSDRSEDVATAEAKETIGPVSVELPSQLEVGTLGQPTLAPPTSSPTRRASGQEPTNASAQPHTDAGPEFRHPWAAPEVSPLNSPVGYPNANVSANGNAVHPPEPMAAPHPTPRGYSPWQLPSLPQFQGMESLSPEAPMLQTLPPLEPLPNTIAGPRATAPTTPRPFSAAIRTQGYLYPSTNGPANAYGQPTHVVQQPEWVNSQPRR